MRAARGSGGGGSAEALFDAIIIVISSSCTTGGSSGREGRIALDVGMAGMDADARRSDAARGMETGRVGGRGTSISDVRGEPGGPLLLW